MKHTLCFFLIALLATVFISGCGPSAPTLVPPTQKIETVATSTTAQVAQAVQTPTATATPSATQATATPPRGCNPPAGWSAYTVKPGDTLFALAKQVNLTPEELMRSNCLASSLIGVGDTLYLPVESCTPSPPAGWRIYVVRSGDTLFSQASTRNTTVAEVKRVNCLVSDSLDVGQQLYLPPLVVLPSPPPPPQQPQPAAPPSCPSVFSCSDSALPPLVLAPGGPNEGTFTPCTAPSNSPWLDTRSPSVELGERRYFFACNFPAVPVSATVKLSDGSLQSLQLLNSIPNPDLKMGNAQAVVEWLALPTQPIGNYVLSINDGSQQAQFPFQIILPTREHILTVPAAAPPGTVFHVYYVNFPLNTIAVFDFFGENQPAVGGDHTLSHRGSWQVPVTQPLTNSPGKGWAQALLTSAASDLPAAYSITYDNLRIFDLFWLR